MRNGFSAEWGCFWGLLERTTTGVLSCGNTKTETRPCGCYRQHTPQTALHNPKTTQTVSRSARSSRRRVHVAGGLSGRPCVVYGGLPHTRTHSSRRRAGYAASARPVRVGGGACPWMWLCGRWRRCAEARRRRDAAVRQESRISRMTKISELGCQQTPFKQPGAILGS